MSTAREDQSVDYCEGKSRTKLELAGLERRSPLLQRWVASTLPAPGSDACTRKRLTGVVPRG